MSDKQKCPVCKRKIKKSDVTTILGNVKIHKDCHPVNKKCYICKHIITDDELHEHDGFGVMLIKGKPQICHSLCCDSTPPDKSINVKSIMDLRLMDAKLKGDNAHSFFFSDNFWKTVGSMDELRSILSALWRLVPVQGEMQSYSNVVSAGVRQIHKGKGVPYRILVYYLEDFPLLNTIPKNTIIILVFKKLNDEDKKDDTEKD